MADRATPLDQYRQPLESALTDNVLDFWFPRSVDDEHGGFLTSYDREGAFAGNGRKQVVTQARMVWVAARVARAGYGDEYRAIAEAGFDFLVDAMWDDDRGGFYWEVERDGTTSKPNKHLYGQAFGLYACSELARVTDDERPAEYAHDLVSSSTNTPKTTSTAATSSTSRRTGTRSPRARPTWRTSNRTGRPRSRATPSSTRH
ncbi:AGE family epimerase/isomerase [Halosimplex aquaticum]